ncbi:NAD(P)-binding protein [Hyaloscypha variabilis]
MEARKILIVGASGRVGRSLLQQLLATSNPPSIRVSTRDRAKVTFPSNVEVVQGNLEDTSSYPELFNAVDRAFIYANPRTRLPQLLSAAKDGNVQYIVLLSSMMVEFDPKSDIGKAHVNAENAIKESGIAYTFIRPRNFSSNTCLFWAPIMERTGKLWMTYPRSQTAPVSEDDIAAVALVALTTGKLHNQAVPLCGPISISQQEQVEAINRLRQREGKKPIDLIILPPEEWKAKMMSWRKDDFDPIFADQLIAWWKENEDRPELIQSSERITGQSYEEWLELNKDAFLKD